MARTHEVPNHLNVEDTLFLGLTARQVATFMAFASPAYGIWDQLTVAPAAGPRCTGWPERQQRPCDHAGPAAERLEALYRTGSADVVHAASMKRLCIRMLRRRMKTYAMSSSTPLVPLSVALMAGRICINLLATAR